MIWRTAKDKLLPKYRDSPWLLNDKWQTASVRSDSKISMWGAWVLAAPWALISVALIVVVYVEVVEKDNYLWFLALLFPLIGIVLLAWVVMRTREWHRFGSSPVLLDTFPGSIGGHVGGTIDIRLPFNSQVRPDAELPAML